MNIENTVDASDPHFQPGENASPSIIVNGNHHQLADWTPSGQQVLAAVNLHPATDFALLLWPSQGPTREIGLDEILEIPRHGTVMEFLAHRADGVLYFVLNDERFAWAGPLDGGRVRTIGRIEEDKELWLERRDEPDLLLEQDTTIDLKAAGVERMYTKHRKWKLDVQGVVIESNKPLIGVRDALKKAGFDPNEGWIIILKVKDEPKRQVTLADEIDLRTPGIERLRLTPDKINNGEGLGQPRRQFSLLPKDEAYLNGCGYRWQTITEGRRWLLISDYPLPPGYNQTLCNIAIEIPPTYPVAEIDMFYCNPSLLRKDGVVIPKTEAAQLIEGISFQRWSRHRVGGVWSPEHDSLMSHMGLVEEAIAREVTV
jgi:hypothetical protein